MEADRPARPKQADPANDPEAAARGIAERFIGSIVAEVDDCHEALAAVHLDGGGESMPVPVDALGDPHAAAGRLAGTGLRFAVR